MCSWYYPEEKKLTKEDVEAYAEACSNILYELGIFDEICKMYDPLTIKGNIAHSYQFDLKDSGRYYKFKDLESLKKDILEETIESINDMIADKIYDEQPDN